MTPTVQHTTCLACTKPLVIVNLGTGRVPRACADCIAAFRWEPTREDGATA